MNAGIGNRKRNGGQPGLERPEETSDVVKGLRRKYHCPIARRSALPEALPYVEHAPVQLRPRQRFRDTFPILLVINECHRCVVGLQARTLAQHSGNRRLNHGPHTTSDALG
ncbi:hypothetical protein NIIDMKKI_40760 [Mycobacterium kansasii]|uniref:Uncharacterized protein n=1 Tax=Mycobacterium kansasii TaxID=1768 RepID=A0A7G1IDJ3_MYCKA|nr:hypothetical protein NIIDMKKI_40760 [Mycobacterium kansasii]